MSLWVALYRIKRQPFLKLTDVQVANYHEIKENVLPYLKEIDELADFPSLNELRRYISRETGEDKDAYYDRAIAELPKLKETHLKYKAVEMVLPDERDYLEAHQNYEELFFLKRCYDLEKELKVEFQADFSASDGLAIVLDEDKLERFCRRAKVEFHYERDYIYKLVAG